MKTLNLLIKRELLQIFKFNKILHGEKKEKRVYISISCTILVGMSIFAVYWFKTIYQICSIFQSSQEVLNYFIYPLTLLCSCIIFFSTIIKGSGVLYSDKSIDILFAYPIKERDIVVAKLFCLYLWGLAISIALLLVPLIRYESFQYNILFSIMDCIHILVSPIIPVLLGVIFGYIIHSQFAKFFRSISYVRSVLYLILFIVFMVLVLFAFNNINLNFLYEQIIGVDDIWIMIKGAFFTHEIETLLSLTMVLLIGGLLFTYILMTYKKKCIRIQISSERKSEKKQPLREKTKLYSLLIREMKRYFSIPVYVINTMLGIVLLLLFTVYSCFEPKETLRYGEMIGNIFKIQNIKILLIFAISLLIVLSNTTYASISIEGKNRDVLKAFPISLRELLTAKYLFHLSMTIPVICIAAFVMEIVFKMNIAEMILCLALPITVSAFAGMLGLFLNLLFPNYNWENVTNIIKQSIPAVSTIFLSILIIGGSIWCLMKFFNLHMLIASYILMVLLLILTIILALCLRRIRKNF